MSNVDELNQEIEQLEMEVKEQRNNVMTTGGVAFIALILVCVAVYLVFSNLFTMFEGGGGQVLVGFILIIVAGILLIKFKVKQRSEQARILLARKTKSLEAKKGELERYQSANK